jgi:hypothetical protein
VYPFGRLASDSAEEITQTAHPGERVTIPFELNNRLAQQGPDQYSDVVNLNGFASNLVKATSAPSQAGTIRIPGHDVSVALPHASTNGTSSLTATYSVQLPENMESGEYRGTLRFTSLNGGELHFLIRLIVESDGNTTVPSVAFTESSTVAPEGEACQPITVTLSAPYSQNVSVNYAASGGTASPQSDFEPVSGTLHWAAGQQGTREFCVPIHDDGVDELDETIMLTLSSPTNCVIEEPNPVILTIVDDDGPAPGEPALSDGYVSPPAGTAATDFTLCVRYTDPSGNAPSTRTLQLKRLPQSEWTIYEMADPVEGTYASGALICRTMRLQKGTYRYRFLFRTNDNTTLPYYPTRDGAAGPSVGCAPGLQVEFWSIPSGPFAYQPGQSPRLRATVRDPDGQLTDAVPGLHLQITPPGGQQGSLSSLTRTSLGEYEYDGTSWTFGCGCYTFLAIAPHPTWATGQARLDFEPCPCPSTPPIDVLSLSVSPSSVLPGTGSVQVNHCVNVINPRETIRIKNAEGQTVGTLVDFADRSGNCWTDAWDGLIDGQPAPLGEYGAEVEAFRIQPDHALLSGVPGGPGCHRVSSIAGFTAGYHQGQLEVYVLDDSVCPNRMVTYDPNGNFVREWPVPCGWGSDHVADPRGIATDNAGQLYIWSKWDDGTRVNVWETDSGTFVREFGRGAIGLPQWGAFYVDALRNRAVVATAPDQWMRDDWIVVFDLETGVPLRRFNPGPSDRVSGVAIDGEGNIWAVLDTGWVRCFSDTGVFLGREFNVPVPVTNNRPISCRNGHLLYVLVPGEVVMVLDLYGHKLLDIPIAGPVQWLRRQPFIATPISNYTFATVNPPNGIRHIYSRITDYNSVDVASVPISVVPLVVTKPNGGEVWRSDTTREICWKASGALDDALTIRLFRGGAEVANVSPLLEHPSPSMECISWKIPCGIVPDDKYRIRIEWDEAGNMFDMSDAEFAILPALGDGDADGVIDHADAIELFGNSGTEGCLSLFSQGCRDMSPEDVEWCRNVFDACECKRFDFDFDYDVDLRDVAAFQRAVGCR